MSETLPAGAIETFANKLTIDPDNVSVRIIDGIVNFGILGATINMTLATNRIRVTAEGKLDNDYVIAARLRFDPNVGRLIRDAIDAQLKLFGAPEGKAN